MSVGGGKKELLEKKGGELVAVAETEIWKESIEISIEKENKIVFE